MLAGAPEGTGLDAFWLVEGRLADWGPVPSLDELVRRTAAVLPARQRPGAAAHVPAEEIDEVRIVSGWLARHPETATLAIDEQPDRDRLARWLQRAAGSRYPARSGAVPRVGS